MLLLDLCMLLRHWHSMCAAFLFTATVRRLVLGQITRFEATQKSFQMSPMSMAFELDISISSLCAQDHTRRLAILRVSLTLPSTRLLLRAPRMHSMHSAHNHLLSTGVCAGAEEGGGSCGQYRACGPS